MIQLDLEEAIRAKEEGINRALDHRSWYRELAIASIGYLAARGEPFSADDVRLQIGDPPAGVHGNVLGALFSHYAKRNVIRRVDYRISAQKSGHGNLIRVWIGS